MFGTTTLAPRGRRLLGEYSLDQYMREAGAIVSAYNATHADAALQAAEPLFLYFAEQTAHIPLEERAKSGSCTYTHTHLYHLSNFRHRPRRCSY